MITRRRNLWAALLAIPLGAAGNALAAESDEAARALMDSDPSVQNRVFVYEFHPFHVFYADCVPTPKRSL
jgi:hypothetical protein